MRYSWAPLAFAGLTLAARGLFAQMPPPLQAPIPAPKIATILVNQADVYSAPGGANAYPTGQLRYGESVVVMGESQVPGWLVIMPPPGSFSWIEAKYVQPVTGYERIGIVNTGDPKATAPIMPGAPNKEPSGVIARVATGTQLLLLDRPTALSGGVSWYRIVPVATEVRFVPLDAVRSGGSTGANTTAYGGATTPVGWQTPIGPSKNAATPFYELAKHGDQALAEGNLERARFLYFEAIAQTNDLAWRNYLLAQLAKATPNNGQAPAQTVSNPAGARPVSPTSWSPTAPPAGPASVPPAATNAKTWSPDGVLRGTGFTTSEGQPMYVLESLQNGAPQMYVAAQKGYTLQGIAGQIVTIYGTLMPRSDPNITMQLLIAENYVVRSTPANNR